MKTINCFKIILPIIAIIVFIFGFNSCKKINTDMPVAKSQSQEDSRAAAIKALKDRYGNVSAGVITNVFKDPKNLFYRNASGNMVQIDKSTTNNTLCNYNCGNTSNPADLHLVYTLSYVQRNYLCESISQSDMKVSWTISVPFTPLVTYGLNTSSGTLKITDPGSTLHTYSGLAITMRNMGADANCAANTLYEISYTATAVPDSYFGSGMSMDASLSLYNDCALVGNLVTTGDVSVADAYTQPDLPCYRVDKVWVNPPGGGTNYTVAFGNYNICWYPTGFTPIDYHQLEYRFVTSGSSLQWGDQSGTIYWAEPAFTNTPGPTISPYTGTFDLVNMTASSGTWLVRYRNVKTSVCDVISSGSPGGNWGSQFYWVVEVWSI